METAAAILLKAIVDNNSGLKARVSGMSEPRQVEEVLKPYYQAAFSLVKRVSSGQA
jgi:hypothetical protein